MFDHGSFLNQEACPIEAILRQVEQYETLPQQQRTSIQPRLDELYVVLLRTLVSDQLTFLRIARRWFHASDFRLILGQRIGSGKIGGKSAGMLLAHRILVNTAPEIADGLIMPRSYFIGADVFDDFQLCHELELANQKYKTAEQIRAEYPAIQEQFASTQLPDEIVIGLRDILTELGRTPLIVRSSSLLEDSFGASFAGKYISIFCPNQAGIEDNLAALTLAVRRVYASVFSLNALMYRRRMGLLDYDERMAILIQEVQGGRHQKYYFPTLAGVANSYSPAAWNMFQKREDGFLRIVMGLGTRATGSVRGDYPRMVDLGHPLFRPELSLGAVRDHSQRTVDVLDMEQNALVSIPIRSILGLDLQQLRWLASVDDGDVMRPLLSSGKGMEPTGLILTFDGLLRRSSFVPLVKTMLTRLTEEYKQAVDVEFTVSLAAGNDEPKLALQLLQCRPATQWGGDGQKIPALPSALEPSDKILCCTQLVPQGVVTGVEYIVYVDGKSYAELDTPARRSNVARAIGRLNGSLRCPFILIGPGRWGSSDAMQGVPVTYADIFNASALVEITGKRHGFGAEPSFGTHFYQDLVESRIFPLALDSDRPDDNLNWDLIRHSENCILRHVDGTMWADPCIKVIHIPTERPGYHLEIAMDGRIGLGYLLRSDPEKPGADGL